MDQKRCYIYIVTILLMSFVISLPMVILKAGEGSPVVLVNHILAMGEEIGWRGYLLPLLMKLTGTKKAIVINGSIWGLAHAVLVAYGVNYSGKYVGKPFTGILMMILFATVVGTFLSFLTLKTNSIIPACIAHGAINAIREAPLFIAKDTESALLGPKPSGFIGMSAFIVLAIVILCFVEKNRNEAVDI